MYQEIHIPAARLWFRDKPMTVDNPKDLKRAMIMGFAFSLEDFLTESQELWECDLTIRRKKKYTKPEYDPGNSESVFTSGEAWQPEFWEVHE